MIIFTTILSHFQSFGQSIQDAQKNIKILSKEIEIMDYTKLSSDDIVNFISNISFKYYHIVKLGIFAKIQRFS